MTVIKTIRLHEEDAQTLTIFGEARQMSFGEVVRYFLEKGVRSEGLPWQGKIHSDRPRDDRGRWIRKT